MLLKNLSELNGTSGAEKPVRDFLRQEIEPYVDDLRVDKMGNLIARKNMHHPGPKVMLAAHMDEVALIITEITAEGFLKFRSVGGIDPRILLSKVVKIGDQRLNGVIGSKAIHLTKLSERQKSLDYDQLSIDIGAKSKEEASTYVQLGDYAYFDMVFEVIGDGILKGKALDDRIGCAVMVEILKREYDFPLIAAFTVQEEVGLRGAKTAAYHIEPDFAIVLEGTVSGDMPDVEDRDWVTEIGKGPACSIMDNATLYPAYLVRQVADLAKRRGIPLQFRRGNGGGNDAGVIHLSRSGIPTLALSVPCRYIHSFASLVSLGDFTSTIELVDAVLREIPDKIRTSTRPQT
ncbi:MAG: M42 family metallopeptidase [Desulfitobacteriaceae bacterium]